MVSAYHRETSWQGIPEVSQRRCHDTVSVTFRKRGRQVVTGFQRGIERCRGQESGNGAEMVSHAIANRDEEVEE